jgi:hypothetical protein
MALFGVSQRFYSWVIGETEPMGALLLDYLETDNLSGMETEAADGILCDGINLPAAEYIARTRLLEMLHWNAAAMRFFQETVINGTDENPGISVVFCLLRSAGRRYLVMEFVAGGSLVGSFGETGKVPPLMRWLQGATRQPLPADSDVPRWEPEWNSIDLIDFGFAKMAAPIRDSLCGTLVVTPEFVAPRKVTGPGGADLAKVCSAGITLYEMLRDSRQSVQGSEKVVALYQLSPLKR